MSNLVANDQISASADDIFQVVCCEQYRLMLIVRMSYCKSSSVRLEKSHWFLPRGTISSLGSTATVMPAPHVTAEETPIPASKLNEPGSEGNVHSLVV